MQNLVKKIRSLMMTIYSVVMAGFVTLNMSLPVMAADVADSANTDESGLLIVLLGGGLIIIIAVVISVVTTVVSSIASVVDDEEED